MSNHWTTHLPDDAVLWAATQPSDAVAWAACERGDWMLWWLGSLCISETQRKRIVLAACECARLGLGYGKLGSGRPLRVIETAEQWARSAAGTISPDTVMDAAHAYANDVCYTAANAGVSETARRIPYDAAYAAYADRFGIYDDYAAAASGAADSVAYAAFEMAADADNYTDSAAYRAVSKQCADIVRRHFPLTPCYE